MKILYGIKDGAVLQREENNLCKCYFKAECEGMLRSTVGKIQSLEDSVYELSGIPVGGPYEIGLQDDAGELCLHDIYVGDVWILAGQSNMEGAGRMRQRQYEYEKHPVCSVRAYYMNESWDTARPQLHQLWESIDACIRDPYRKSRLESPWRREYPDVQRDGVGPGLYFALEMQRRSDGVPQGVIPCGIGGSNLEQWRPDTADNLYAAAKRRFHACGGNVKGVFWYQGESQTWYGGCASFVSDMKALVAAMRRDFKNPVLPFVQVQINKYHAAVKESDRPWIMIREMQRTLERQIDHLATVYSMDCGLDDLIHLSSESQEIIGARAAEAMDLMVNGSGVPSPQFDAFEIVQDDYVPFRVNIMVRYRNIVGGLHAPGVPYGFSILDKEDGEPIREISRTELGEDAIRLKVEINPEQIEDYYVCYGYGNTYYCNITDGAGRSIPGMGPLRIKDYLK